MKAAKEKKSTGDDSDDAKTARALLALMPDFRALLEAIERVALHVQGLAKRYGVEDR